MYRPIRLIPVRTDIKFIAPRWYFFGASVIAAVASLALLAVAGLNFGIDFRGGILIEARASQPIDLSSLRSSLGQLGLGEIALQGFGGETNDVLIRVQRQPGGEGAQQQAVEAVKERIATVLGEDAQFRRVEVVGPQVGGELVQSSIIAVLIAIAAMMVYIWVRFEWQFGIGAVVALFHDVLLTVGLFALLQLDFNMTIIAALLTIVGYSMNDKVVIFDRIRENLRKYKAMPLPQLIDLSINETLSRTIMTSGTTFLAVLALYLFGGDVISGFSLAVMWGIVIGTYSSIYIAAPVLLYTGVRRVRGGGAPAVEVLPPEQKAKPAG